MFVKYDKRSKSLVPMNPPHEILQGLLERGHWGFPRVSGVITAPTLRPDGSILDKPGHDPSTQLWLEPDANAALPKGFPIAPTMDDARRALATLKELLVEFPFVAGLDCSVALAAVLTAIVRGAFDVAPMFLFAAHAPGSGKSYLVNLISTIVHGRTCPVISGTRNPEEMEKRLGALLLLAPPLISLDNLSYDLEGDLLCQITEQRRVRVRVLGKSETPECEWRGLMAGTGNNVGFVGDMTRRGLTCHLDAAVERPEMREFAFDPVERVLSDRGRFIGAALTISRAYFLSASKVKLTPIGSYGGWSQFVREPLVWLGEPDPVKSMDKARDEDPERRKAIALLQQWEEHLGFDKSYTVAEIIKEARDTREAEATGIGVQDWEYVRPEFAGLLLEKCPAQRGGGIDARDLGKWLSRLKGQVFGDLKIFPAKESKNGNRWALVKLSRPMADTEGERSQS